ncbi:MAG: Holliday junction branch migration DNA helicase RuvB [Erysipelotrichaceae bacterium]
MNELDDLSLRPHLLNDYIGQCDIKKNLEVFIRAAKKRNVTLDHVLLCGPPGLGKTTLAHIIANEMNANIVTLSGPTIEKTGDLVAILSTLNAGDILFIDEIHRIPKIVEEVLYPAMEDYFVDIIVGSEATPHSLRIELPPFTLIGATTRKGELGNPLRDRFGIILAIQFYHSDDIAKIIKRNSALMCNSITPKAVKEIALRARGTPRIANHILKRISDFALVMNNGNISNSIANHALKCLNVDRLGLNQIDIKYLKGIADIYGGGPVGIDAIANSIGEECSELVDIYEPYLLQIGFIKRTSRGRTLSELAYNYLKDS